MDSRCAYLEGNCLDDVNSEARDKLRYLWLLYCRFLFLGSAAIVPILVFLLVSFAFVGTIASDFLCPNLYTISKLLRLSDRLSGLTLLALGNGAPDVLGTYQAMKMNTGSLAVAELVGAAFFATTIVVGSMAVVQPFKVRSHAFLIDFAFFVAAAMVILASITQSALTLWSTVALLSVYVGYVVVLMGHHWVWKSQAQQRLRERHARGNFHGNLHVTTVGTDENFDGPSDQSRTDNDFSHDDVFLETIATLPTIEELILHEHHTMDHGDDNNMTLETGSYGLKVLLKDLSKHSRSSNHGSIRLDDQLERPLSAPSLGTAVDSTLDVPVPRTFPLNGRPNSPPAITSQDTRAEDSQSLSDENHSLNHSHVSSLRIIHTSDVLEILSKLLPDSCQERNIIQQVHFYATYPLVVILGITAPTVDYATLEQYRRGVQVEDEDALFTLIQCVVAISFVTFTTARSLAHIWLTTIMVAMVSSLMAVFIALRLLTAPATKHYIKMAGSILGFVSSLCWISLFATEIISIFQALATNYNISDDILGLTLYAWGNSVGDLISNFTVARMGLPLMAFGACFGAPLLSLCLLGVSALAVTLRSSTGIFSYELETNLTVKIMAVSMIANMCTLLAMTRYNNWMIDRKVGAILILSWFCTVTVCVVTELYTGGER